jgi:hypothetical protein
VDVSADHGDTPRFVSSQTWPPAACRLALDHEMTVADWWFAALDQRPFTVDDVCWTTQVVGVHLDGFDRWIQIEFAEHGGSSVLLHLAPLAGLQDAVDMIHAALMGGAV